MNVVSDLPQHHLDNIKAKLRSTYTRYNNSKTAKNVKKVIDRLSKNNIIITKQDKGCGVVINITIAITIDHTKYIDKCLSMLATKQFSKLDYDSTSKLESKVQRSLR